jgi:putative oxidoreductase
MLNLLKKVYCNLVRILNNWLAPLWDIAARAYLFRSFFYSGMVSFNRFLEGKWETTVFLYTHEHPVPFLKPEIAAVVSTAAELTLPILLLLGFASRFCAAGLLVMSIVIELTYMQATQHYLWMFLASSLMLKGAGTISLDHLLCAKFCKTVSRPGKS